MASVSHALLRPGCSDTVQGDSLPSLTDGALRVADCDPLAASISPTEAESAIYCRGLFTFFGRMDGQHSYCLTDPTSWSIGLDTRPAGIPFAAERILVSWLPSCPNKALRVDM